MENTGDSGEKISELSNITINNKKEIMQIKRDINELESLDLGEKIEKYEKLNISERVAVLEIKVQNSLDLTDDIVGTANNLIATTESRVDTTLSNAENVLDHADFISSTFLVVMGLLVAGVGLLISYLAVKRQTEYLKEAIDKITDNLNKDEDFKNEFIKALISHENLRENVRSAIDQIAQERVNELNQGADNQDVEDIKSELDFSKR